MRAAVHTRYGSPDAISLREVEPPVPKDDELLIEVHATTVNRTDCQTLLGKPTFARLFYGLPRPRHQVLGCEFAGRVTAVGRAVTSFSVGDDVVGYDDNRFGGHAGSMTIPESGMVTLMPTGLSFADAAPIAEGAHYALTNLRAAGVGPGQRVLVNGATGGIGSAAVQLAVHMGADVTGVCARPHLDLVASLGAARVIDYTTEDFTTTGQEEYDLVLDAVGKRTFGACKPLLKPGGIYSSSELGPRGENTWLALWTSRFGSKKVIFPIPRNSREDLDFLTGLVETGAYRPVIDRTYPFEQIVEAFRYVETGQKIGNVVITVRDGGSTA